MSPHAARLFPLLSSLLLVSGCGGDGATPATGDASGSSGDEAGLEAVASENLLPAPKARVQRLERTADERRELEARLESIRRSDELRIQLNEGPLVELAAPLFERVFPDESVLHHFEEEVEVRDLDPRQGLQSVAFMSLYKLNRYDWRPLDFDTTVAREDLSYLHVYLRQTKETMAARFHLADGRFAPDDDALWFGEGSFELVARDNSGRLRTVDAEVEMTWHKTEGDWRIRRLAFLSFPGLEGERKTFASSLDLLLPDQEDLEHVRASGRDRRASEGGSDDPTWSATNPGARPAIAAVDIDGDGWDDLFGVDPDGPTYLLRNGGRSGFVEEAAERGLAFPSGTSTACFADFDNDGDQDLFLGRTRERSLLLWNEDGEFTAAGDEAFDTPLPYFASSATAVDYDSDGLTDLFVGTQAGAWLSAGEHDAAELAQWFGQEAAERLVEALAEHHTLLDRAGPPDLLFRNEGGGRFALADAGALSGFRETSQATFADYDRDGDPDAWVANAFGPDVLARNDDGHFVDATAEAGIRDVGPSEGASWSDFDGDGDLDLFVSKTWSSRARSLIENTPGINPAYQELFRGNSFYRNEGGGSFLRASASGGLGLHLDRGREAASGLFIDADNDGDEDLVAFSGRYTPAANIDPGPDLEARYWELALAADLDAEAGRAFAAYGLHEVDRPLFGGRRAKYFLNEKVRFRDLSMQSRIDVPGDGSSLAILDYNRDGWTDVAGASASTPRLQLFKNDLGRAMQRATDKPRMIAVRLVGGNATAQPSTEWSNRDGLGARIRIDTGEGIVTRELRGGEGRAGQSSRTLVIGIGRKRLAKGLSVSWPSGREQAAVNVPQGSLVTVYENPAHSPTGDGFDVERYAVRSESAEAVLASVGTELSIELDEWAPVNVIVAINTHEEEVVKRWRHLKDLVRTFGQKSIRLVAVSTDPSEGAADLEAWNAVHDLPIPVLSNVSEEQRIELKLHILNTFGKELVPAAVALDANGVVLRTFRDVPLGADLNGILSRLPEEGAKVVPAKGG